MRPSLPSFAKIILICLFAILAVSSAFALVQGALQTTDSTGTQVNGNIYAAKDLVYITGGPQKTNGPGLVPDGTYYFQVTDPSGSVLLSTDDVTCRQVVVSGGRITGVTGPCSHALGTFDTANGEQPVQLVSFNDTPNPGGEYKSWINIEVNYSPDPTHPNCSSTGSYITYGFCDSDSKTDNVKVKPPPANLTV